MTLLLLLLLLLQLQAGSSAARATSSFEENKRLADEHYHDSPLEHWVAMQIGELFPRVRDDLIARKQGGEGIVYRHLAAWAALSHWLDIRLYGDGDESNEQQRCGGTTAPDPPGPAAMHEL